MKFFWLRNSAAVAVLLSGLAFGLGGCGEKEEEVLVPPTEQPASAETGANEAENDKKEEPEVAAGEGESGAKPLAEPQATSPGEPQPGPAAESKRLPVPEPPAPEPEPAGEPWSLAHAGFAAKLPPDVDFYLDARKLQGVWDLVEQFQGNKLLKKLILEWMGDATPLEEYEELLGQLKETLPLLLKDEVFLAARGVARPAEAGLEISNAANKSMGREMTKALASGDLANLMMEGFGSNMPKEFSEWIQSNMNLLEGKQDLALYLGGRMEDKMRREVRERLAGMMKKAAVDSEELEPAEWEAEGVQWSGFEFSGKHVPALQQDTPPEGMEKELWAELRAALQKLSVVVACAEVGEFVVVAAGLGREALALTEVPEKSLAGSESFQFLAGFEAQAMMATTWASKRIVNSLVEWNRGIPLFEGIEAGLKAGPPLRRKGEMLKAVGEFIAHYKARSAGSTFDHVGVVLKGEEIRYETQGGWMSAGLDLESPLTFPRALGGVEQEAFLRGHWKMKKEYVERGHQQVDAAMRALRLVSEEVMDKLAEGQADDEEMSEKLVRWKRDLVKGIDDLGEGYRDHFAKAFGEEWALVADLRGEMIPALGMEEEIVKKGRIPRVALVRPVLQGGELAEAWKKWQGALTNLFAIVAEAVDQPIPFPDTMTAEKDELRTYFFPFPFASDDFLPSVSVSEGLFILGSSKTLSEKVYESSLEAKGEGKEPGMWIEVNAEELWKFCEIWLNIHEARLAAQAERGEEDLKGGRDGGDWPGEPVPDPDHEHEHEDEIKPAPEREHSPEAVPEKESAPELEIEGYEIEELSPDVAVPPAELAIPESEVENPLLRVLQGEEGEAPQEKPGPVPAIGLEAGQEIEEDPQAEIEELLQDEIEFQEMEMSGPASWLSFLPEPEVLRAMLGKARGLRSLRYRRWVKDGVPRASLRMKWVAP